MFRNLLDRVWSRGPLILLYHRVADMSSDPQLLAVSRDNFTRQMDLISRKYHPMSLTALVDDCRSGQFRKDGVVVTFDDGYHDNLAHAKPILDRFEIPVTFFVTSANIETGIEFWWDELEKIFLETPVLPPSLRISTGDFTYSGSLGGSQVRSQNATRNNGHWNVLERRSPTERHTIYRDMCGITKKLTLEYRSHLLDSLYDWAQIERDTRESHRPLTKAELGRLAAGKLVEIGGHGDNHLMFAALSHEEQAREVAACRNLIVEVTGRMPAAFSYPYGGSSDYVPHTVNLIKKNGFRYACSNFPGLIGRQSDPYQLPRFLVRNWDIDRFSETVQRRMGG